ncbi:MAG TPA: exopolyphosphatase [Xanthomonadaceae bacterium]|nr:exopolyphosphatase [Xanthomonadaceae bacterium]
MAGREPLNDGDLLAAVDLGSNSFHMVVARYMLGQLRIVDRLRETVRLAAGLDGSGNLAADARDRAIAFLAKLGQRLRELPDQRVRAIATSTVRQLRNPQAFLMPAETALGHPIEVVSGREEARLIYLGVARGLPPKATRRLVVDIGGGSTEFVIGQGYEPLERESLQMGCVATTRRFFGSGKLSKKRWKAALTEISAEFQQFAASYRERGWDEVTGSSGTIKAIGRIHVAMKLSRGAVTAEGIAAVRDALLEADAIDAIRLPTLSAERRPVLTGGLLILEACFNELDLARMKVAETAMREGVLYDMLGRARHEDPRDGSIAALAQRYGVDAAHADRVEATARALFAQVREAWTLDADDLQMLVWATRVHELGLAIAHSQYQMHGAYVIENSDIAGFSRQEQQRLAALVRCHRRTIPWRVIEALPERMVESTLRVTVLLRLAAQLHRSHDSDGLPDLRLAAEARTVRLHLPRRWLERHPLTRSDLETERSELAEVGMALELIPGI